ncbi:hypothetical protein [Bradyrhizobium retamae]|uniref:Uncharacterized protein n=1 Tax=Bradyrhizobium retamae TaxID=1300035 RepID=A0A0R3MN63_9BRAD|nr:hypothetical protein [Bradyrhizobium retamae]KRR21668.1 hypothetical protein CQ13_06355 [Bradyrhizobium retamae]
MGAISKAMRRNESYQKLSAYLSEQGYPFEPVHGSKHPYLLVDLKQGSKVKFFFPASASDHRSADNCVAQIKRLIRERLGGQFHHDAP